MNPATRAGKLPCGEVMNVNAPTLHPALRTTAVALVGLLVIELMAPTLARAQASPVSTRNAVVVHAHTGHLVERGLLVTAVTSAIQYEADQRSLTILSAAELERPVLDMSIPGDAKSAIDEAQRLAAEGRRYYDGLEFEMALASLTRARDLLYRNRAWLFDNGLIAQTLFLMAMVYYSNADGTAVDAVFRDIALLDDVYQADPALAPPIVARRLQEIRRRVEAEPMSRVNITSTPPGATVIFNGQNLGVTPLTRNLRLTPPADGKHYIIVQMPGYVTFRGEVALAPGQTDLEIPLSESNRARTLVEMKRSLYAPNAREAQTMLARNVAESSGATATLVWTLHPIGNDNYLVLARIPADAASPVRVGVAPVSATSDTLGPSVSQLMTALEMPGPELVTLAATPPPPDIDFTKALLGAAKEVAVTAGAASLRDDKPVHEKWWFWVAIVGGAAVLAGAGVATYFLTQGDDGGGGTASGPTLNLDGQIVAAPREPAP